MTSPESPQDEIDFYGFDSADMAQLPLGIIKQVRRLISGLHKKTSQQPDQYHPSSHSSDPSQRHYGTENRTKDYQPIYLGVFGDGLGAVATDYANQLAQTETPDSNARMSLGHVAQHETMEGDSSETSHD